MSAFVQKAIREENSSRSICERFLSRHGRRRRGAAHVSAAAAAVAIARSHLISSRPVCWRKQPQPTHWIRYGFENERSGYMRRGIIRFACVAKLSILGTTAQKARIARVGTGGSTYRAPIYMMFSSHIPDETAIYRPV